MQAKSVTGRVEVSTNTSLFTDPSYYSFTYEDMDRMLQLIEKYRNFRPSNAYLDYGVMFFPESDLNTNKLHLVAKACVILPQEAVPLNMAGNYFQGVLHGEDFFAPDFISTFKKSPKLANGAPQAYTFTVLQEAQVQFLLGAKGTVGIKAFQVKIDYLVKVESATTSIFYNLNIVNDIPGMDFGTGATFMMTWPCPPVWR